MLYEVITVGIHESAGGAESSDLTMASLGAIHEFGAEINHPGGTSYGYATEADASAGKVRFFRITSYNVCYTKLLRSVFTTAARGHPIRADGRERESFRSRSWPASACAFGKDREPIMPCSASGSYNFV